MAVASIKYRKDIDGLRAIAILYVIGYHFFPYGLRNGYVGVDIFFVISGFLISSVIIAELAEDKFSFSQFYKRRIHRLFPTLVFVLLFCFVMGWILLTGDEFKQLNQNIVAGGAFVSNLLQLQQVGYFEISSETKPLLHLWSLGVEEQFYFFIPLFIFFCWSRNKLLGLMLLTIGLLSFVYNINIIHSDITSAFYSPLTRVWELIMGCLLAYIMSLGIFSTTPIVIRNFFSIAGVALLASSVWLISSDHSFPGWWALLPTFGALFMLAGGPEATINRTFLSHSLFVSIGKISYPLYLWHWPLIALMNIVVPSGSVLVRILVGLMSFIFAYLTYRYVEKPFRFGILKNRIGTKTLILGMSCIIVLGILGYQSNGFPSRDNQRNTFDHYFDNAPPAYSFMKKHHLFTFYRDECNFYDTLAGKVRDKIASHCYVPSEKHVVFIWGDSYAQHLYYGLSKALPKNVSILQVTSSGCWPHIEPFKVDQFLSCNRSNHFALEQIKKIKPDVVILTQIREHEKNNYKEIVDRLRSLGVKDVFVLGPVPQWNPYLYKIILRNYLDKTPKRIAQDLITNIFSTNEIMKTLLSNIEHVHYLSPTDLQCNDEGCIAFLGDDVRKGLVTFDNGHLTPTASKYIVSKLLINPLEACFAAHTSHA